MRFGVTLPNIGPCGDPTVLVELAVEAEAAGWDGVFVWDSLQVDDGNPSHDPTCDPWIALAAIAARTERVRVGPLVTPPARRRPWKLAREVSSLDQLSRGRAILPVGLGAVDDGGFAKVGEPLDRRSRAERLDESLAIIDGLASGEPFSFSGKHYTVDGLRFLPRPVQQPRVPIWVTAAWPWPRSLARALRWDGIMPIRLNDDRSFTDLTPAEFAELSQYIDERRGEPGGFDLVMEAETPDDRAEAVELVGRYAAAGVTWWLEAVWKALWARPDQPDPLERMRQRIHLGPPHD